MSISPNDTTGESGERHFPLHVSAPTRDNELFLQISPSGTVTVIRAAERGAEPGLGAAPSPKRDFSSRKKDRLLPGTTTPSSTARMGRRARPIPEHSKRKKAAARRRFPDDQMVHRGSGNGLILAANERGGTGSARGRA
jgi:hypothetical protein